MVSYQFVPGGLLRFWSATAATQAGVATFYATDDQTAAGAALFAGITTVFHGGESNTATATAAPFTSLKAISQDRTTITVNCVMGTVLGILGATLLAAPDGTQVHCLIVGT